MRIKTFMIMSALLVTGCMNTLRPVQMSTSQQAGQTESCGAYDINAEDKEKLDWYVCALAERADANLRQSLAWQNSTEWRDIPLFAAAATVVGLLLFGNRDSANNLTSGSQEALEIVGFGAATFGAFSNYLSPQNARKLLRQGARGHRCMAAQGEIILSVWDAVESLSAERDEVETAIDTLNTFIAAAPNDDKLPRYIALRDAGVRALALYDLQNRYLLSSSTYVDEAAWNFGIDLLESADRQQVDVAQLVETLNEQAASIARFNTVETPDTGASGGGMGIAAAPPATIEAAARELSAATAGLLSTLPNVEALVLGFDRCAATALIDGNPTATRVQRVNAN